MSAIMSAPKIGLQPSSNQVSYVTDSLDIKVGYVYLPCYMSYLYNILASSLYMCHPKDNCKLPRPSRYELETPLCRLMACLQLS
jgi:hypothetical protein